ncbi:DUF775-domain-containing protein [Suhomyces tanzawaensis NRRL Y-17324]|uniref:DUF775-domain-containing protein n=1 Tax=Suhomyces tanzawaensis NRRL Y-17324 TaxID=984487 RepID=A0A1E4SLD1_9ASCO|nr:DUF775-domain-containing protein [Suhomyces tanzawaensis NRRL Y-17324]ODV80313.1 DUF775-domain-containing protein [Suhomyces tanzawaensis NRRL Y-17324]
MFGAVCSGRPIQLAEQVEPTKYVVTVPNASNINFITIFLLPNSEFVDVNYTALIYFKLPSQEFQLLGGINPNKPSAIYRLNNKSGLANRGSNGDEMNIDDSSINYNDPTTIQIGISIEPTPQAEVLLTQQREKSASALVPAKPAAPNSANDIAALGNKIVGHAYNYLGSFIDEAGKVPMKAFDNWWDKFKTKLANNPNFLDTLQ